MIVECSGCQLRYDVTGRPPGTRARCRCGTVFVLPRPRSEAKALSCPGCGAPCPPSQTKCEYCDAVLATARCPKCFGLVFRDTKHCQHCGAEVGAPARAMPEGRESQRQCPRCSAAEPTALVANLVAETLLDQCNSCGGLWVDQTAFERITEEAEKQQGALQALGSIPAPKGTLSAEATKVVYLRCPDCDKMMNRRNYAKRSGVIIDVCKAHGIWFDHDELTRVIRFVKDGGLDESRRQAREEHQQAMRRRSSRQSFGGGSPTRSGGHRWLDAADELDTNDGFLSLVSTLARIVL